MIPFALYLLKVIACSALLMGYYYLGLRNKVFHQWNRFYLLSAVLLSLIVPLLQFTMFHDAEEQTAAIRLLQAVSTPGEYVVILANTNADPAISWQQFAAYIYVVISVLLLVVLLLSVFKLFSVIKKHEVQRVEDIHFLNTELKGTPFSFFNYLFWNRCIDINTDTGKQIFRHELVHVREHHTLDKLFLQITLVFFWCNPVFWLLRNELRLIHEFIADKKAVAQQDASVLATMILQTAYPANFGKLINPFFHQSIKRRIAMLTKIQNPRINYVVRLLSLPLVAVIIMSLTIKTKPKEEKNIDGLSNIKQDNQNTRRSKEITSSQLNTIFEEAKDTVPAQNKKEIREVNLKDEKVEVVYSDGTKESVSIKAAHERGIINVATKENLSGQPSLTSARLEGDTKFDGLVMINGKTYEGELSYLDPNKIQSINVLKGELAFKKYGEKGAKGVLEITMKKDYQVIEFKDVQLSIDSKDTNNIKVTNVEAYQQTFTKVETDPAFPGGKEAWTKYLMKNLNSSIPVDSGAKTGTYTVMVQFIVDKDGSISDIKPLTKHGYGMEAEVLRIIKASPPWLPAIQNGRKVRAYKKQPVTFVISEEDDDNDEKANEGVKN